VIWHLGRDRIRRNRGYHSLQSDKREQAPANTTTSRQETALNQQLPYQARTCRAYRRTDRYLPFTYCCAREQKIRNIAAGNEKQYENCRHHRQESCFEMPDGVIPQGIDHYLVVGAKPSGIIFFRQLRNRAKVSGGSLEAEIPFEASDGQ
jgi:hypothetical protein